MLTRPVSTLAAVTLVLAMACSSSTEDTSPKYSCQQSSSDGCYCSVFANGATPAATQIDCSPSSFPGTTCCADSGWPGTGMPSHSCSCTKSSTGKCTSGETAVSDCKYTPSSSSSSSASSSSSSSGGSCDLKPEKWYTECGGGCGGVMTCQSFCSGCPSRCYVTCETDADCTLVGAGSCEESAKGTNRCSKAPTKCR